LKGKTRPRLFLLGCIALLGLLVLVVKLRSRSPLISPFLGTTPLPPLVMQGGDPYVRALMRTIAASEANDPSPYAVLYGGQYVTDLSRHPDRCVAIAVGPNVGDCTTAAGRYQFITTTWLEKAQLYHPQPSKLLFWESYSFEPEFQDAVVYAWLKDSQAWGVDISELLRNQQLNQVLALLSPTWTSLGYGIETNSITGFLPGIYQKMLQEELQAAPRL
jgi:muramidase (phage lysozyme)